MSVFCVRLNEVRVCLWFIWIYIESTYVYEWEVFTWYMYIYYILWVLFWIMEVYAVRRVHQTPETHALTRFIEQRFRLQSVFYFRQLKSRAEHTTQHNNPENHPPHTLYVVRGKIIAQLFWKNSINSHHITVRSSTHNTNNSHFFCDDETTCNATRNQYHQEEYEWEWESCANLALLGMGLWFLVGSLNAYTTKANKSKFDNICATLFTARIVK